MTLHLVLYHPAIPQNTGNIARTTVGMGAHLHLIHPMKFEITEHAVRRAGLDHWPSVTLTEHLSDEAFLEWLGDREPWLVTKFGTQTFDKPAYGHGDVIILGNENSGLPDEWRERWLGRTVTIPMPGPLNGGENIRSYNLANAAAIVLSQARLKLDR